MTLKNNEYFISALTKILMVLVAFFQQALIARYLGTALKGEVSYIQNLIGIFNIVYMMGLHHVYSIIRKRRSFNKTTRDMYITNVSLLFLALLLISISICVVYRLPLNIIVVLSLSPVLGYSSIIGYIFLIENPNKKNLYTFVFSLSDFFLNLILFFTIEPSLFIGCIMIYLVEIIKGGIFFYSINPKLIFRSDFYLLIYGYLKMGFLPMLSLVLTNLNYKIDIIMLSNSSNVSLSNIGVYSVAIAIAEKALLLPDSMKDILISRLAKGADESEVVRVTRYSIILTFITSLVIALLCDYVVKNAFGYEYIEAVELIRITTFSTVFMVFFKTIGSYNVVNNKQFVNLFILTLSVLINIFFNRILINSFGYYGAAYATIISFISCGLFFAIYFTKLKSINFFDLLIINSKDIGAFYRLLFSLRRNK